MAAIMRLVGLRGLLAVSALALSGCGGLLGGGGPPKLYVLGDTAAPAAQAERGRPLLVRTVTVPEYLDSTDLLRRTGGNELTVSETGKWGERVSTGVTRALAAALGRRVSRPILSNDADRGGTAQDLIVDVESVEARADGTVVLAARWQIYDADRRRTIGGDRVVLEESGGDGSDQAIVGAMSRLVDKLAEAIAAKL
jgi:uncharacterized lipoprotein YmbA